MRGLRRVGIAAWRLAIALLRPSAAANRRRLRARGESLAALTIRDATVDDLPAIARLHVAAWNATYAPMLARGPSVAVRERQWREAFARGDPDWLCLVVERADGTLVGLAQANRSDDPAFAGELRKIYLLADYQRLGLGRRLVAGVARRFLARGIDSMWLWGDARNPSQAAWRALGAVRRDDDPGSGNWGWHDLRPLAAMDDGAAPGGGTGAPAP